MKKKGTDIAVYRSHLAARLSDLLQESEVGLPLDAVQNLIFEYNHARFKTYVAQMLALFRSAGHLADEDAVVAVIQDAWNYFPHRSLNGRCPAEVMADLLNQAQS